LQGNLIEKISAGAFSGLKALTHLYNFNLFFINFLNLNPFIRNLQANKLVSLEEALFINLTTLNYL
jgi:hypothetical protein